MLWPLLTARRISQCKRRNAVSSVLSPALFFVFVFLCRRSNCRTHYHYCCSCKLSYCWCLCCCIFSQKTAIINTRQLLWTSIWHVKQLIWNVWDDVWSYLASRQHKQSFCWQHSSHSNKGSMHHSSDLESHSGVMFTQQPLKVTLHQYCGCNKLFKDFKSVYFSSPLFF